MSEKTEKATSYKLQKAKEKGQVSRSNELTTCMVFLVALGMLTGFWFKYLAVLKEHLHQLINLAPHIQFTLNNIHFVHTILLTKLLNLWSPFAFACAITIILVNVAQSGLVWSTTLIFPDFKRLNIAQGVKKLFSLKTCFDGLKSTLKLILTFSFLFFTLKVQLPKLLNLTLTPIMMHPYFIMHFLLKLMFQLILLLVLIAFIDKYYTQWKFAKDQRMSKQEVKDEYKQREGDPKIKAKIKQLQNQLRQKTASINQIKTADVVITNPSHLAIALKYDCNSMPAPKVVCKAQNEMAQQVKKMARKYGIPLVENKSFARVLYHSVDLNQWINKEFYPLAARIFREVYAQRKQK